MGYTLYGTLYNDISEPISKVEFTIEDSIFYISIKDKIDMEITDTLYVLKDHTSFPFHVSVISVSKLDENAENKDEDANYIEIVAKHIINERKVNTRADVRIPICIKTKIFNDLYPQGEPVMIHNLSAKGLMFSTEEILSIGSEFSVELPFLKENKILKAVIKSNIPMFTGVSKKAKAYGCMFLSLNNKLETEIRSYVYKQQLKSRKCKDE